MKNLHSFEEFLNESVVNEAFAKDEGADTFDVMLKEREKEAAEYGWDTGEGGCDLKLLVKHYEDIAKHLKGNLKTVICDMSEISYELVSALYVGLNKRHQAGDANIKLVSEFNFNSAWHSAAQKRNVQLFHIVDANINVAVWMDGDDYADFEYFACLKKDHKNLIKWVNTNMSEADMNY
jgi:hypothetical protein